MQLLITIALVIVTAGCAAGDLTRADSVSKTQATVTPPVEIESSAPDTHQCQNTKGIIGNADISFDADTVIHFYSNPITSREPAQTLKFYEDTSLKMFSFRPIGERSYSLLRPEVHKLDYFLFHLPVLKRQKGWIEVIVDDSTKETLWVREEGRVKFEDWLHGMKDAFAVGRISPNGNPVRERPEANARVIKFDHEGCFKVEEMKGDWIKVIEQSHCSEQPELSVSGWIRWRDENGCLLVEIFPFA